MCETLEHECWKLACSMSGCWTIMNFLSIQIKATSCVSAFCSVCAWEGEQQHSCCVALGAPQGD